MLPQRFVAVVFDDTDMIGTDASNVRYQAQKFFDALPPADRVGIFTTSGQVTVDFTAERMRLKDSLSAIMPRPLTGSGTGANECPSISFYQARQIVEFHDIQATNVAEEDLLACLNVGRNRLRNRRFRP